MALIVQKYGGTSVGTLELINQVAQKIATSYSAGHQMVIVVSAMSGDTNRLINLATSLMNEHSEHLSNLELDLIATTGEQVSVALLSIALKSLNIKTSCYCAWQLPIITTPNFKNARIKSINTEKITHDLSHNKVVIITGFQGITEDYQVTTLGRGGSDTSAVAIAVALKARECQIYTDVDGIYNIDPRLMPTLAKLIKTVDGLYMLETASLGAKVLHVRSCELGYRYKLNIRVLSSFATDTGGTLIMNNQNLEHYPTINITQQSDQILFSFNSNSNLSEILTNLYKICEIDMLQINSRNISFVIDKSYNKEVNTYLNSINLQNIRSIPNLTKISLIGSGFRSNLELNQKVWTSLENVEIFALKNNEISLSLLVHEWDALNLKMRLSKNLTDQI